MTKVRVWHSLSPEPCLEPEWEADRKEALLLNAPESVRRLQEQRGGELPGVGLGPPPHCSPQHS